MEAKTPFSDSDLIISRLEGKDYLALKDFSCGTECLDHFFHNEIELCAKYKYLSPYCAKIGDEIVGVLRQTRSYWSLTTRKTSRT